MEQNDALQQLEPEALLPQDQDATLQSPNALVGTLQALQQRVQALQQGLGQQQDRGQEMGL